MIAISLLKGNTVGEANEKSISKMISEGNLPEGWIRNPPPPEKPTEPCLCGATDWWALERNGKVIVWRCPKCHPDPKTLIKKEE